MKVRKFISILLLVIIMSTAIETRASASFNDVNTETKYNEAILNLQEQGVVNGKIAGNFNPDDTLKAGEWYAMLSKALKLQVDTTKYSGRHWAYRYFDEIRFYVPKHPFLIQDAELASPINFANAIKIGMCSFGYRSVTQMKYLTNPFTDLENQSKQYDENNYLLNAYYLGILPGEYTDKIEPARYLTRGEACQIIANLQTLCNADEIKRVKPEILNRVNIEFIGENSVTYYNDVADALSQFSDEVLDKLNTCGKIIVTDEDQSKYISTSRAANGCYLDQAKQIIIFTGDRPQNLLFEITTTLTHEIGHFIHYNMLDSTDKQIIQQSFNSDELRNFEAVAGRDYCTTNFYEYFAEVVSYYTRDYKKAALDRCDCQNILAVARKYVK